MYGNSSINLIEMSLVLVRFDWIRFCTFFSILGSSSHIKGLSDCHLDYHYHFFPSTSLIFCDTKRFLCTDFLFAHFDHYYWPWPDWIDLNSLSDFVVEFNNDRVMLCVLRNGNSKLFTTFKCFNSIYISTSTFGCFLSTQHLQRSAGALVVNVTKYLNHNHVRCWCNVKIVM